MFGCDHLVGRRFSVADLDDVATFGQRHGVAAVFIGGDGSKTVIGEGIADGGIGDGDGAARGFRGERIGALLFGEVNHIMFRVQGVARQFIGCFVLVFVQGDARFDSTFFRAYRDHKNAGVFRPDRAKVGTARGAFHMDGVIGDQHNSDARFFSRQQSVFIDADHIAVGGAVLVEDGVMVIGFDEIVVDDIINDFPIAQIDNLVGFSLFQLQITLGVDVQEDIRYIVTAVGGDITVDCFRVAC